METETSFIIELAVPGLTKENFDIQIENHLLTIKAEKVKEESENQTKNQYTRQEFDFSTFKRSFRIGKTIDTERIEARYEHGILRLELPKKEQNQEKSTRNISIV